ncbi:MAG: lysophospholipid acyltransferase family protein [Longimicrobiales bacterium]
MMRTLWTWLIGTLVTIPLATLMILGGLFGASGDYFWWGARSWGRCILWASNVRVRLEGVEHLALDRPQVIVSNHSSWFDVFALAAKLPKRYRFVAKIELARIPVFGRGWVASGHIAIDRSDHVAALAAMDRAGEVIRSDNSAIIIFPEGTRSPTGEMLPFKKGGFMVALRTGADLLPCAVIGSRDIHSKADWRVRSGEITIRFGEPVATAGCTEQDRGRLIQRVRGEIAAMLEQPAHSTR